MSDALNKTDRPKEPRPAEIMSEKIVGVAIRVQTFFLNMPPPARHGDLIADCIRKGLAEAAHGEQGFVTSETRFVDREEALRIATMAGQLKRREEHAALTELFSEDLW